ncbi:MAG: stage III sporulation protein AB [Oscillospiraceae bacterium]|nr:stage III sporulation protein AB [Oscillospiraceae bacterium]
MKAYGIACIFIGAAWGMRAKVSERRRRRRLLSDLRSALARMADEIRMARAPLPDLLKRLAATCGPDAAAFFRAVAESGGPSQAWGAASDALPLSAPDRQTLRELAPVLRGDEEQIRKALQLASGRFERSLQEFDRTAGAELRQSAALIFSAAALIVILLY